MYRDSSGIYDMLGVFDSLGYGWRVGGNKGGSGSCPEARSLGLSKVILKRAKLRYSTLGAVP